MAKGKRAVRLTVFPLPCRSSKWCAISYRFAPGTCALTYPRNGKAATDRVNARHIFPAICDFFLRRCEHARGLSRRISRSRAIANRARRGIATRGDGVPAGERERGVFAALPTRRRAAQVGLPRAPEWDLRRPQPQLEGGANKRPPEAHVRRPKPSVPSPTDGPVSAPPNAPPRASGKPAREAGAGAF
jgi:hypothetical protein